MTPPTRRRISEMVVKKTPINPPCLGSGFSHYLSFRAASAPPSPWSVGACASIWSQPHKGMRGHKVVCLHASFITFLCHWPWPPPLCPTAMLASWLLLRCHFPDSGGGNECMRFCVIVWERKRWWPVGTQRAPRSWFFIFYDLLIVTGDGASSGHPGGSSRGSCNAERFSIFWSSCICYHWCSGCWASAPRSQVWTPGLPTVFGEGAGARTWRPGLEWSHASTWCSRYWPHPGATMAGRSRRLQHWGEFNRNTQRELECLGEMPLVQPSRSFPTPQLCMNFEFWRDFRWIPEWGYITADVKGMVLVHVSFVLPADDIIWCWLTGHPLVLCSKCNYVQMPERSSHTRCHYLHRVDLPSSLVSQQYRGPVWLNVQKPSSC